jgi:hypothetical protein
MDKKEVQEGGAQQEDAGGSIGSRKEESFYTSSYF